MGMNVKRGDRYFGTRVLDNKISLLNARIVRSNIRCPDWCSISLHVPVGNVLIYISILCAGQEIICCHSN